MPSNSEVREINIEIPRFKTEKDARTNISIDENTGTMVTWCAKDTMGIFPRVGSQVAFPLNNGKGAGTNIAKFDGGGWALRANATYASYYPYNIMNRDLTQIPVSYLGQCQHGNASTAHLGQYDFLASSAAVPEKGSVKFDLKRLGAFVQFKLKIPNATILKKCVVHSEGADIISQGSIDLTQSKENLKITPTETCQSLSMNLKGIETHEPNEEVVVSMMLPPCDFTNRKWSIRVLDSIPGLNVNEYEWDYELQPKNLKAGYTYLFTLDKCTSLGRNFAYMHGQNVFMSINSPSKNAKKLVFEVQSSRKIQNAVDITLRPQSQYEVFTGREDDIAYVYTTGDRIKCSSAAHLFYGNEAGGEWDLKKLDTSEATSMSGMFSVASKVTKLDLSNFDTRNVTNMASMFQSCTNLEWLNINSFITNPKMSNMNHIFNNCHKLAYIDFGPNFVFKNGSYSLASLGSNVKGSMTIKCNQATKNAILSDTNMRKRDKEGKIIWHIYEPTLSR